MVIDSHQHLWDRERVDYPWLRPEHGPLFRSFHAEELAPQLRAAGVDRTVLVQAACSFADTDAMLAVARAYDWVTGVVGWVPLADPDAAARALDTRYAETPLLRGIRHLNHDEPDPDWLVRPDVLAGIGVVAAHGLVLDVVAIHPLHLGHVPTIARAWPDLTIVVDHLAKPPIASGDLGAWRRDLAAAAAHPNVVAKVSGLNTVARPGWTAADLVPAIGTAVELFGTDRLMAGSDWPVALLNGDYASTWAGLTGAADLLGLDAAERAALFGGTAIRVYGLARAATAG